jgi:hypothetical protein
VYDIASLSADDARGVMGLAGGVPCPALYVRRDGTVMKADCPVAARRRRVRRWLVAAGAVVVLGAAGRVVWERSRGLEAPIAPEPAVVAEETAASAGDDALDPGSCPAGCELVASGMIPVPSGLTMQALRASQAMLCFQGECYSSTLASIAERHGSRLLFETSGDRGSRNEMWIELDWNGLRFDLRESRPAYAGPRGGDVYGFVVRPAAGGPALVRVTGHAQCRAASWGWDGNAAACPLPPAGIR